MIWIAICLMILAVWNFFVGMGVMAGILIFFSVWLVVELLLKNYHGDDYHYY